MRTMPDPGDGPRRVAERRLRVLALGAEDAVEPAVLVGGQAHVGDVGVGLAGLGQRQRVVPEPEVVDPVVALGHGEEALVVAALDARHQADLAVPQNRPGARDGVHAEALDEPRVAAAVEVVAPEERRVGRRQHRVLPALEDAALVPELAVLLLDEIRVLLDPAAQRLLEVERHRLTSGSRARTSAPLPRAEPTAPPAALSMKPTSLTRGRGRLLCPRSPARAGRAARARERVVPRRTR